MSEVFLSPEIPRKKSQITSDIQNNLRDRQPSDNLDVFRSVLYISSEQLYCSIEQPINRRTSKSGTMVRSGNIALPDRSAIKVPTKSDNSRLTADRNRSTIYLSPRQIELRQSLLEGEMSVSVDLTKEMDMEVIQRSKSYARSLARIQKRQRQRSVVDNSEWTWDTSAALIRLMKRSSKTRIIMNLYIWLLMMFRVWYLSLLIRFMVEGDNDGSLFFWLVFGVYLLIRVVFSIIAIKVLATGYQSNDPKVRIVYEMYKQVIDQHPAKSKRCLIIMMIVIPPEFSFVFLADGQRSSASGYYQVQNMIMKSLEVFFFVPFLIYFMLSKEELKLVELFASWSKADPDIANWTPFILLVDMSLFAALTIYLLLNNQKKKIRLT